MIVSCLLASPACCLRLALHVPFGRRMTPTTAKPTVCSAGPSAPEPGNGHFSKHREPEYTNRIVFNRHGRQTANLPPVTFGFE